MFCYAHPSTGFTMSHLDYVVLELISLSPSYFPPHSVYVLSCQSQNPLYMLEKHFLQQVLGCAMSQDLG